MTCTANQSAGLFDCDHCLIAALQNKNLRKETRKTWLTQIHAENAERYAVIVSMLRGQV